MWLLRTKRGEVRANLPFSQSNKRFSFPIFYFCVRIYVVLVPREKLVVECDLTKAMCQLIAKILAMNIWWLIYRIKDPSRKIIRLQVSAGRQMLKSFILLRFLLITEISFENQIYKADIEKRLGYQLLAIEISLHYTVTRSENFKNL